MELPSYTGYLSFAVPLWLVTGAFILRIDVKGYKLAKMDKESKVCRFIGWLNVCLGLLAFAANWSLHKWGW